MNELVPKAMEILHALAGKLGETVALGTLVEDQATGEVQAASDSQCGFSFHVGAGHRFPLHASAPGKVLLAYLPPNERDAIIANLSFRKYTPGTITDEKNFKAELDDAFAKGFAIDISEQIEGCHCVGVPVFNEAKEIVAAIWATGPSSRLPIRNFNRIAEVLKAGAHDLGQRLRSTGRSPNRTYIIGVAARAKTIMDNSLHAAIDMQALAKNLHVGYSWFRKVFKEQTGQPPAGYHLGRRMQKAAELLEGTDHPVREISEELGFVNQNHFSALFKRKTGMAPTRFRHMRRFSPPSRKEER